MDELRKMVIALANSVSLLRYEMVDRFEKIDEKLDSKASTSEMKKGFTEVVDRLDKQLMTLRSEFSRTLSSKSLKLFNSSQAYSCDFLEQL